MSEALWNIIGVTLIGSILLFIRNMNGDKIHPQIVTAYWIVFFVISLFPLHMAAQLGAAIKDVNYISEATSISGSRHNEYLELAAILDNQNNSSILHKTEVKNLFATSCLIIWTVGFILNVVIKTLKNVRVRNKIKENCIGIHSSISIGKKNNINVIITEDIGPMVYGIRPAIYVPKEFMDNDILNSILAHEKNHIIRKHHLLLLLIDATSCVYWFLPYYEKIFMKALREDMEYRCDYEVIKNTGINPKEYALHYAIVNGYQSGLNFTLNFSKKQAVKRINRVLDFKMDIKKSVGMSFILGITVVVCIILITNVYLMPDINGFTKWEIKQAKETVVKMINAANKGDEQRVFRYIDESGPLSNVTDFTDMQYDLYYIDYFPSTSSYYEKKYREQYQLQANEIIHLEGIFKIKGNEVIWGYTLIFDETDGTWKLYDWGQ
ncbi:MAG: M56 family metallopeptidase [Butyrivibrio sp.]|nr:M56 family metallopeptidase [Butyrivibrio sp.]